MSRGLKEKTDDRFPAHVTCNKCGFTELNKHFDSNVSVCGDCYSMDISYIEGHMECRGTLGMDSPPPDEPRGPGRPSEKKAISLKICGSTDLEWPERMPSLCNKCGETKNFAFVEDKEQLRWNPKKRDFVPAKDFEKAINL